MIRIKEKKCKGTGAAKGFGCGELYYNYKYGLCYKCYKSWWYNSAEALSIRKSGKLRSNNTSKKHKQETNNIAKTRTIAQLIQATRYPFQKLIRYRDFGKTCICCDKILGDLGLYDAGHFIPANISSQLIFHPDNVHGQNRECNQIEAGNYINYKKGIKRRISEEEYNNLFLIKKKYSEYKWDRHQLHKMRACYQHQLRLIENGEIETYEIDFRIGIID